jgi:hypothetical protein
MRGVASLALVVVVRGANHVLDKRDPNRHAGGVTVFQLSPPPMFAGVTDVVFDRVPADHPNALWLCPNPFGEWVTATPRTRWLGWDQFAAIGASVREVLG